MRRREFLHTLSSIMTALPFAAYGQQADGVRRIGVITIYTEADPEGQIRVAALKEALRQRGWIESRNIEVNVRWSGGQPDLMRAAVTEFVNQPVEVIVVNSTPLLTVVQQLTNSVPVVFTQVADPIGSGFVTSYSRPGANLTGFTDFDASIAQKWVQILKEAVPAIDRVTVLVARDQKNHPAFVKAIEAAASVSKLTVSPVEILDRADIERAVSALSGQPNQGLIVLPGPRTITQREVIIQLAARFRLPAIYPFKYFVKDGGLLYYGIDQVDQWARAADYVDRILRGEKPGDLPIQAPTKFELIVNAKTAKALGLALPSTLLATADEVIE